MCLFFPTKTLGSLSHFSYQNDRIISGTVFERELGFLSHFCRSLIKASMVLVVSQSKQQEYVVHTKFQSEQNRYAFGFESLVSYSGSKDKLVATIVIIPKR